jgi:hypothetical protein
MDLLCHVMLCCAVQVFNTPLAEQVMGACCVRKRMRQGLKHEQSLQ